MELRLLLLAGGALPLALLPLTGFGLRRWLVARLYDRVMARYEAWIGPRRAALLEDVRGTVLEIGPGTGANLAYYPPDVRWVGVEPNHHMHAPLARRASAHDVVVTCHAIGVESMQLPDASVDVVVGTLVLCSVRDPVRVLREVHRVLKPGGHFLFLEHVAAPRGTPLRRRQQRLRGVWRFCTDGCTPDRETAALIRAAGFAEVATEAFEAPAAVAPAFLSPHVLGRARK